MVTLSLPQSELPEEIATAIEELAFAYYSHGLGVGDGTLHQIEPRRSAEAHSALTAAILSRLGEAEARREEASQWQPIEKAPKGAMLWLFEPHAMGGFQFCGCRTQDDTMWVNNLDGIEQHPTHWMPMPASPSLSEAPPQGEQ